jgi:hypothetical protein
MEKERSEMGAWPKFDIRNGSAFLILLVFVLIVVGGVVGTLSLKSAPTGYEAQMLWTGIIMGVSPGGTLIGIGLFIRVLNDVSITIKENMKQK